MKRSRRKSPHTEIKEDPDGSTADEKILNCLLKNSHAAGIKLEPCSDPEDVLAATESTSHSRRPVHRSLTNGAKRELHECAICSKTYKSENLFLRHVETHDESVYRCTACGRKFTTAGALDRHNRAIHNQNQANRKFLCSTCGKTFPFKDRLDEHMRIHTKEMPFSCEYCERRFRSTRNLNDHVRSHEDVRPFSCPECGLSFFRSNHLSRHQLIHTGERPHICPICHKTFRRSHTMQACLRRHKNLPQCRTCKERFDTKEDLKKHNEKSHKMKNKDLFCEYCYDEFKSKAGLQRHMNLNHLTEILENASDSDEEENGETVETTESEVRIFACKYCWRLFKDREELLEHHESCKKKKL